MASSQVECGMLAELGNPAYRMLAIIAIVVALLALWAELAVDGVSQLLALLF